MSNFEKLFLESKGKPIEYKGNTLYLIDSIVLKNNELIEVVIESTNSKWRQGIALGLDNGQFITNGNKIGKKIGVWQDTAPTKCIIEMTLKGKDRLKIYNIWDTGDGVIHSWHNGAAMKIEEISGGKRYLCNDGYADEDFDDVIFTVVTKEKL